jgi:hypothetical protein
MLQVMFKGDATNLNNNKFNGLITLGGGRRSVVCGGVDFSHILAYQDVLCQKKRGQY